MPSGITNRDHPIWNTLHVAVVILTVTVLLKVNASQFDQTEFNTIMGLAVSLLVGNGGIEWLRRKKTK